MTLLAHWAATTLAAIASADHPAYTTREKRFGDSTSRNAPGIDVRSSATHLGLAAATAGCVLCGITVFCCVYPFSRVR
jgi:hypothetical protein